MLSNHVAVLTGEVANEAWRGRSSRVAVVKFQVEHKVLLG